MRGRGRYTIPKGTFARAGKYLGGHMGGMIGNMVAPGIGGQIGSPLGKYLGQKAGSLLSKITGTGDYTVHENSLLYPDRVVPSFGEDTIRVRKREYICSLAATQDFTNLSFPINPGLSEVFPWLSNIANNYDQYRVNGMVFQFVSTSSDAIADTSNLGLGQIILASDYNSADAPFVNAPQMLGSMFANSGKPSENIMHAIECAPTDQAQKLYYVRSGDIKAGTDIRLYDLATFQIATYNSPADYTGMGQLWVSYDITFCKSVQNNQLGYSINTDKIQLVSPSNLAPFGTGRNIQRYSNLGCTITNNSIIFPPTLNSGYYLINWSVLGNSTAVAIGAWATTNCERVVAYNNDGDQGVSNGGSTSIVVVYNLVVRILREGATIVVTSAVPPTAASFGDLVITQVNGELYSDLL